jgi:alpha-mannosidase
MPMSVKAEYWKYQDDEHRTTPLDTLTTLLEDCIRQLADQTSNEVFILVDAFDEFQTEGNKRAERKRLRKFLYNLTETKKARLLITTRPEPLDYLRNCFKNSVIVEINADPGDIDKYIEKEMEDYTGPQNNDLKNSLKRIVKEGSKGLYRPSEGRL